MKCMEATIIETGLNAVLSQYELFTNRNTRDHLAWTKENGYHARGVFPTQYTSRMKIVILNRCAVAR